MEYTKNTNKLKGLCTEKRYKEYNFVHDLETF